MVCQDVIMSVYRSLLFNLWTKDKSENFFQYIRMKKVIIALVDGASELHIQCVWTLSKVVWITQ